jgi:hypothetical protein
MPIIYARYVHRKPEPDAVPATFDELEEETVLLFDPVAEATTIAIGDLYRRLDLGLRASEIIVFRGAGPEFIEAIENDPLLPDNLIGKRVMALIGSTNASLPGPALWQVPKFQAPDKVPRVENLRQAELAGILLRSQAIFTSSEYHYELPSTWHAENFVRLADALRSVFDIRRITDWLLPFVTRDTVVLADTGSMLPLLIDLREQARSRFGWNVEISTLDRYPQNAVMVSDAIAAVQKRPIVFAAQAAETELGFLFLISVNSSGRLCRLFRSLGPPNGKIVVVCQTSQETAPCDQVLVTVPVTRWEVSPDGTCERCKSMPVIRVHHESYELLPSIKRERLIVGKSHAEEKAQFWTMADAADAVQLHVNVPYIVQGQQDSRHFSVFLNTAKLASHPPFRQGCIEQLSKVAPPDLILIPEHQTSRVVAELCQEVHPGAVVRTVPPGRLAEDIQSCVARAERILVADDAIVTGSTLLNLRTELFRVTQLLNIIPLVNAFVFVSRPSNNGQLQAIRRRFGGTSGGTAIVSGVELLLPDGSHCPWCAEFKLLARLRDRLSGEALTAAESRISKLEGRAEPPLLMVNSEDDRGDLRTLGSYFGTLRQPAAFAAGVSAAQTLIQKLGTLGGGIQLNVIDLAMAIDAYYEGILLASLLRTFDGVHVRYPGSEPQVEDAVSRIDLSRAYPGVVAELALAAIENKIPSKQLRNILERGKSKDPWLMMLADIMDEVGPT